MSVDRKDMFTLIRNICDHTQMNQYDKVRAIKEIVLVILTDINEGFGK